MWHLTLWVPGICHGHWLVCIRRGDAMWVLWARGTHGASVWVCIAIPLMVPPPATTTRLLLFDLECLPASAHGRHCDHFLYRDCCVRQAHYWRRGLAVGRKKKEMQFVHWKLAVVFGEIVLFKWWHWNDIGWVFKRHKDTARAHMNEEVLMIMVKKKIQKQNLAPRAAVNLKKLNNMYSDRVKSCFHADKQQVFSF